MKKIDILSDFLKVGDGMPQMHDSKKKVRDMHFFL